ncbi:hypothetical protein BC361_26925 [Ensifer sp. LC54]|nr:hypothetical protein BC363_29005 [Ensifer sp. LC384]OCP21223.1 hypothetical protein BC361_26925 [Ensifer sp. LC54]
MPMTRRNLLALFCCSMLLSLAPQVGGFSAFAKDGDDDSSSGSGSSGSSGHGGGDSGDDDNSGRGGDDDDGDDNSGPGGGDDDGNSGSGRRSDQERARDGVEKGRILALKDVLRLVDEDKYGAVIAVDLRRYDDAEVYRLRTRDQQGTIRNLRINARTGKFMNIFGF